MATHCGIYHFQHLNYLQRNKFVKTEFIWFLILIKPFNFCKTECALVSGFTLCDVPIKRRMCQIQMNQDNLSIKLEECVKYKKYFHQIWIEYKILWKDKHLAAPYSAACSSLSWGRLSSISVLLELPSGTSASSRRFNRRVIRQFSTLDIINDWWFFVIHSLTTLDIINVIIDDC